MELDVDADEVVASLRPIYLDLRQFAAVVAALDVEPDDLVQAAVARVLATGHWRQIHDLRGYLFRAILSAAPHVHGHTLEPLEPTAVPMVAVSPRALDDLDPLTRGLLYLVDIDDYLVDEAAALVGCPANDADRRLSRLRERPSLELVATRGEIRDLTAMVAAAFAEAPQHHGSPNVRRPRARWPIAIGIALALVLVTTVIAVRRHDDEPSSASSPPTTAPAPPAKFAATANGWIFDQGVVRDVVDDHQVAVFPMKAALSVPVRVDGGFVAIGPDRTLWFARENSTDREQLDTFVEGVAATPGGAAIAYSVVPPSTTSATLKMIDVSSRSVMAQLPLDRFARVKGISNPEVLLDTGDGASSSAAIWDPTGTDRVTYLDAFTTVGGVGRNVAVLFDDGTCGRLVTVRNDAIAPLRNVDLSAGDHGCDPSRWEFDASGAIVAGFGMIGAPAELRVSVNRFPVAISRTRVVGAIWVDSSNLAAIDERGQLMECDVSARCSPIRTAEPSPMQQGMLWLIPPRRDVLNDRTG